MNNKYFGTFKSPEDSRDWKAERIYSDKVVLPEKLIYKDWYNEARDQNSVGSCSAMAASAMKECQEYKDVFNLTKPYLSPAFVYNNRSNYPMEGMYGRDAMKILKDYGICLESNYPYKNVNNSKDDIPEMVKLKAKNFKIRSYARVHTLVALKKALIKNGTCYIAFPVYNSSVRFWKKNEGDSKKGGHAVAVVGYDDNKEIYDQKGAFLLRNSGGKDWGDDGYCWYPYSDWTSHWEIWTTIDEVSELPDKNYYFKLMNQYIKKNLNKFIRKFVKMFIKKNKWFFIIGTILFITGIILLIIF